MWASTWKTDNLLWNFVQTISLSIPGGQAHYATKNEGVGHAFFSWMRVVIWWNIFILSNGNFTSRRTAHFFSVATHFFLMISGSDLMKTFIFSNGNFTSRRTAHFFRLWHAFFGWFPGSDLKKHFRFFERKFHFSTVSSLFLGCDILFFWWIQVVIWWKTFIFRTEISLLDGQLTFYPMLQTFLGAFLV